MVTGRQDRPPIDRFNDFSLKGYVLLQKRAFCGLSTKTKASKDFRYISK